MNAGVPDGEIQQLECRLVGREAAAGLDDLAQRTMQRLDRIGRVIPNLSNCDSSTIPKSVSL
jgi:hypothetical protein